jgi:hypothetical protein
MRSNRMVSLAALLLVGLLCAAPVDAQEQTGSIDGVIRDTTGAVLPGVQVEVRNQVTGAVVSAISDNRGVYRFPALPPGRYDVAATLQGFGPAKKADVTLTLGQLLTIDLALPLAKMAESVQVTAEAPLVDVKGNATMAVVASAEIERIPKGRDFTGVLAAAPGANSENRAGGISVDGASGSENRFVIDGIDTTNLQNGSSGKTVVTDFVQEVQVKTAGYNAEYPGATGGVVNALTKSGTNVFHGSVNFYYANNGATGVENKNNSTFWKGSQRPTLRLVPTNTKLAEYVTYPQNDIPVYEPVLELGGPVMRNRLWFYVGYGPVRTHNTRTVTWKTPVAGGPATQTFTIDNPTDRLTANGSWQATNNLRVKFTYAPQWTQSRGSQPTIEPDGTSTANAATDYLSTGSNSWNDAYSGMIDWSVKNNLFVSLSGGYFMYDSESLGNGTAIVHTMNGNITDYPGVPADLVQPNGYSDNKSSYKTVTDKQSRFYVNATGTWFKSWAGQHAIKAGVRFERIANTRDIGQLEPTITFYWNQTYTDSTGVDSKGQYGYYGVTRNTLGIGDIHSDNWGLFIQDSWQPAARLTINGGVRLESERIPFYAPGQENDGIKFGFGDKLAPRVGFAWDVAGNGRWKAYGSFGRYFDITKLELPRGSLGGEQWHIYYYALDTLNWKGVNCQEGTSAGCPGKLLEVSTLRFGSNDPDNPETVAAMMKYFGTKRNVVQEGMKPLTSQEFTVGLDHELNKVTSVGVRYVHKWVSHIIEDFGWNEGGTEFYFIGNPGEGYIGELAFLWGQPNPETGYKPPNLYTPINGKYYPQVKPVRDFDAIELTVKKRLSSRWAASAVYQWSRLWGNYPGLASSDEAGSGSARLSPNVNRLYDGPWMMYNTQGSQVLGPLNTDRPHYLKLQATYDFPWGTGVGANWYVRSGAQFSKYITYQGYSWVFYDGRGSIGRSPTEQMLDLLVQHEFKLGKRMRANVNLNVTNLLDNDVAVSLYGLQFRDSFALTPIESFFSPWDPIAAAQAKSSIRPDPRFYGGTTPTAANYATAGAPMENGWLGRRDVRFGVRFSF